MASMNCRVTLSNRWSLAPSGSSTCVVSSGIVFTSPRAVFFARASVSTRRVRRSRIRAALAARDAPRSVRFSAAPITPGISRRPRAESHKPDGDPYQPRSQPDKPRSDAKMLCSTRPDRSDVARDQPVDDADHFATSLNYSAHKFDEHCHKPTTLPPTHHLHPL